MNKYKVTGDNIDRYKGLMRHLEIAETENEYVTCDENAMRIYVKEKLVSMKVKDTTDYYVYTESFKLDSVHDIWEYIKAKGEIRKTQKIRKAKTDDKGDRIYMNLVWVELELKKLKVYKPISKINVRKVIKEIEKTWRG